MQTKIEEKQDAKVVQLCEDWLLSVWGLAPSRKWKNTYDLKHRVEKANGVYVPEGALITAAKNLGMPLRGHRLCRTSKDVTPQIQISLWK